MSDSKLADVQPFDIKDEVAAHKEGSFDDSKIEIKTVRKDPFVFFVFMVVGCAQLSTWNALLNGMTGMVTTVFNIADYSDTVTATYSTVLCLVTLLFIKVNVVGRKTVYLGLLLTLGLAFFFGFACQYSSAGASSALFHTMGGLMAFASCLIGSSAFGYAAQFPANFSGAMSAGLGLAGVATFVTWMISSHAIFNNDPDGIRGSIWVLSVVLALLALGGAVGFWSIFRLKWVQDIFDKTSDEETGAIVEEDGTYEREGVKGLLVRSWWMGLMYFSVLFFSLMCFPIIGPLNFKVTDLNRDILMGVFQVGDLVGRYLPNVVPRLMVKTKVCSAICISRVIFCITFILSHRLQDTPVFGDFWFQFIEMLLLSLTNGWMCTVCFMRIPEGVEGSQAKGRVSSFSLLCGFIGIAAGQWVGKGIVSIP